MNQEVTAPLQTEVQLFLLEGAHEKAMGLLVLLSTRRLWWRVSSLVLGVALPLSLGFQFSIFCCLFVCQSLIFFFFLKKSSLIQYITPSSSPSIPPALLPSLPDPLLLITLQKRAAFPGMSTKQGISSYNQSKNLSS